MSKQEKWPATKIVLFETDKLIPYARNSRVHSTEQIAQIAASIQEWGFTVPILIDEKNTLIAGHGRLLAAQKLELKKIPVMIAKGWSDAQKRAYVIADNKLAINAEWDEELLKVEIKQLELEKFDISTMGFELDELTDLFLDKDFGETDAFDEWQDMPEYDNENLDYFRTIKIHFDNQEDVNSFAEKTGLPLTEATRFIRFPEPARTDLDAYRVHGDESET
tara:strand:- start:62 stop:724 length:663 start_codon:yes stop_codon:yes gene_type:complete